MSEILLYFVLAFYVFSLAILYLEYRHRLIGQERDHHRELAELSARLRRIENRVASIEENAVRV
ncbi:hypothetical protein LLG95_02145 [bacterium]|nr:hypothetical protein [bacterium]